MRQSIAADPGVVDAAGESKSIADAEMKADADVMLGVNNRICVDLGQVGDAGSLKSTTDRLHHRLRR